MERRLDACNQHKFVVIPRRERELDEVFAVLFKFEIISVVLQLDISPLGGNDRRSAPTP